MITTKEHPALKRTAGTVAVIELFALLAIMVIGIALGWREVREFAMGLVGAGVLMMFASSVSPIGNWRVTVYSPHLTYVEDGAFMVEMLAAGVVNTMLGTVIIASGL